MLTRDFQSGYAYGHIYPEERCRPIRIIHVSIGKRGNNVSPEDIPADCEIILAKCFWSVTLRFVVKLITPRRSLDGGISIPFYSTDKFM